MHLSKYCLLVPLMANLLGNLPVSNLQNDVCSLPPSQWFFHATLANLLGNLPSATCKMMVVLCLQVNGFSMVLSPAKRQLMDNMLLLHHLCDAYKILRHSLIIKEK